MAVTHSVAWLHLFKARLCFSFSLWGPFGDKHTHRPNAEPDVDAVISGRGAMETQDSASLLSSFCKEIILIGTDVS